VSTLHDQAISSSLNGSDSDGDPVTFSQVTPPSNGTVTINSVGSFTYTPNQGYVGQDSFTFDVSDGITDSSPATETIDVTNEVPVANDVSVSTNIGQPIIGGELDATDGDNDPLTYSEVDGPTHGTLTIDSIDGTYTYTPNQGYAGTDSFTYKVNDGFTDSNTATVSIQILNTAYLSYVGSDGVSGSTQSSNTISDVIGDGVTITANYPLTIQSVQWNVDPLPIGSQTLNYRTGFQNTASFPSLDTDSSISFFWNQIPGTYT
jgi:VCBS repeat-containing protein